jgi:hypothetical protein
MTLNITCAARWLMLLSSDFRLITDPAGDITSETAQKEFVFRYRDWSGLLCYTGIAEFGAHNTAEWLTRVLAPGQEPETRPSDIVDRLLGAGKWLKLVPAARRRHSFTMLVYERGVPHIYVVSTFERIDGHPLQPVTERLVVSHVRPRQPRCFATGYAAAVTNAQRRDLERLLSANASPQRMRTELAHASRDASTRSDGKVGESCVVAHIKPDGSGEMQVFGNLTAPFAPTLILNGVNVQTFVPEVLDQAGVTEPTRLVGVTWTGNSSMQGMVGAYRRLDKQFGSGWPD